MRDSDYIDMVKRPQGSVMNELRSSILLGYVTQDEMDLRDRLAFLKKTLKSTYHFIVEDSTKPADCIDCGDDFGGYELPTETVFESITDSNIRGLYLRQEDGSSSLIPYGGSILPPGIHLMKISNETKIAAEIDGLINKINSIEASRTERLHSIESCLHH